MNYRIGVPKSSWGAFGKEVEELGISCKLIGGSVEPQAHAWSMLYYDIEVDDEETFLFLKLKYGPIDGLEGIERILKVTGLCND